MKKLPDIPPRVMSDMEKQLRSDVNGLKEGLSSDFKAFREERLKELLPPAKSVKKELDEVKNKGKEVAEAIKDSIPKELKDRAKSVFEAIRTPLENFKTEFMKLKEMPDKGLITKDTFKRAALDE